jgi:putative transposase
MDKEHLLASARYIALNPVTAGLVTRAEDWPWSSARAHLGAKDDELVSVTPLLARIPDFASLIAVSTDEAAAARLARAATIGRPLGSPAWIAALQKRLGRSIAPRKRGPKPRDSQDDMPTGRLPGIE